MTRTDLRPLVGRLRALLAALYGARLAGVYLYGSHARGDQNEGSDVDILVALDGEVDVWSELKTMWKAPGMVEASSGRVSLYPISAQRLASGDDDFAAAVRRDAVPA